MCKVCHITSVHKSDDIRIFHKECVTLAQAGYDVTLVAPGESREENGVHVVGLGKPTGGRLARIFRFRSHVYRTAASVAADIYHLHDPELLLMARKLKRRGSRVVFDSHEFYPLQILIKPYLPMPLRRIVSRLYKVYETFVLRRIDAVVAICTVGGKNLFEGRARRTVYVNNAPLESECLGRPRPAFSDVTAVAYVGTVSPNRGVGLLVSAAHSAGVRLLLAGRISEPFLQQLADMPEYSCVEYRGVLSRDGVGALLDEAQVGASVTQHTGQFADMDVLNTKIYEYWGRGMPVLCNNSTFLLDFLCETPAGIAVDPDNPGELADALRYLRSHPQEAWQMGETGRRAVLKNNNWTVESRKLLALYKSLATAAGCELSNEG